MYTCGRISIISKCIFSVTTQYGTENLLIKKVLFDTGLYNRNISYSAQYAMDDVPLLFDEFEPKAKKTTSVIELNVSNNF